MSAARTIISGALHKRAEKVSKAVKTSPTSQKLQLKSDWAREILAQLEAAEVQP